MHCFFSQLLRDNRHFWRLGNPQCLYKPSIPTPQKRMPYFIIQELKMENRGEFLLSGPPFEPFGHSQIPAVPQQIVLQIEKASMGKLNKQE